MRSVSQSTLDYYQYHTESFIEQTLNVDMQSIYYRFLPYLPKGEQYILDLGCGTGRDSLYFANCGFNVLAIDGCQALLNFAKQHKHMLITWQYADFYFLNQLQWYSSFTGIWACASLLHLPLEMIIQVMQENIHRLVKDGIFYASFKYGDNERIKDGRFFCDINESRWKMIIEQLNDVICLETWISVDNRQQRQEYWWNVILKKVDNV